MLRFDTEPGALKAMTLQLTRASSGGGKDSAGSARAGTLSWPGKPSGAVSLSWAAPCWSPIGWAPACLTASDVALGMRAHRVQTLSSQAERASAARASARTRK
ncbi:hypothetical protein GCM10010328_66500 [Streptomyces rubiginosohelvolus]|uniref:Uncharacterized protein n=1 Tax=Streptomyces rubiginosohelvolus TaxID=67362 RepID=A0ABQ3CH72_9ACTN|nr:hypothetical protein GCM10010328_66500 [Streptomyces pluricolorescens]